LNKGELFDQRILSMLRLLLVVIMLFPHLAFADTISANISVSVTITRVPQPVGNFSGRRFTQGAASISVSRAGFHNIQPLGLSGVNYYFSAVRAGRLYEIAVAAQNGRILSVKVV
jgi:hypothetical protein